MKKLLFIVCLLAVFIACDDDNDTPTSPIQNLKMPSSETAFVTGASVTIEGAGFNDQSQIWLRAAETKAVGDIQATVTKTTENSITFQVPENVAGEQFVILKLNGQEFPLGKLTFRVKVEELYAFKRTDPNNEIYTEQIVKIDRNSGKEETVMEFELAKDFLRHPVFIPSSKEIIGCNFFQLLKIDLETGTCSVILDLPENVSYPGLFIDDNENLYGCKSKHDGNGNYTRHIVKIDKSSGKEQIIATIDIQDLYLESPVFIPSSKDVFVTAEDQLLKINLENGSFNILQENRHYIGMVIDNNENLYAFNITKDYETIQMLKIDKKTGKEELFNDSKRIESAILPVFFSSTKEIIAISGQQLLKTNIENGETQKVPLASDYNELILVY